MNLRRLAVQDRARCAGGGTGRGERALFVGSGLLADADIQRQLVETLEPDAIRIRANWRVDICHTACVEVLAERIDLVGIDAKAQVTQLPGAVALGDDGPAMRMVLGIELERTVPVSNLETEERVERPGLF